jgi:hypothetical protein
LLKVTDKLQEKPTDLLKVTDKLQEKTTDLLKVNDKLQQKTTDLLKVADKLNHLIKLYGVHLEQMGIKVTDLVVISFGFYTEMREEWNNTGNNF